MSVIVPSFVEQSRHKTGGNSQEQDNSWTNEKRMIVTLLLRIFFRKMCVYLSRTSM